MTKRKRDDDRARRRSISIKVRVIAPRGTPTAELARVVRAVSEGGAVPVGYRIRFVDWSRGTGGKLEAGHYADEEAEEALQRFAGAVYGATVRVGYVKPVPPSALEG